MPIVLFLQPFWSTLVAATRFYLSIVFICYSTLLHNTEKSCNLAFMIFLVCKLADVALNASVECASCVSPFCTRCVFTNCFLPGKFALNSILQARLVLLSIKIGKCTLNKRYCDDAKRFVLLFIKLKLRRSIS